MGTALLIIYSTFAAIYYSKVNPLVSDYEYVDYLGGGRSLSAPDLDFIDSEPQRLENTDNNNNKSNNNNSSSSNSNNTGNNWFHWFMERIIHYGQMFREIAHKMHNNLEQLRSQTTPKLQPAS